MACGWVGCGQPSVGKAVWLARDEEYFLCKAHFDEAGCKPKQWRIGEESTKVLRGQH